MTGRSDLTLWGGTPEHAEEMRGRFVVHARFPGLTVDQIGEVRTVLAGVPGVPPEVFAQIDILLTNCRAAHGNSRGLGAARYRAIPAAWEGELMAGNMVFHAGLLVPVDEARAFRDAALDVGCASCVRARVRCHRDAAQRGGVEAA